jgi:hypothetical protein
VGEKGVAGQTSNTAWTSVITFGTNGVAPAAPAVESSVPLRTGASADGATLALAYVATGTSNAFVQLSTDAGSSWTVFLVGAGVTAVNNIFVSATGQYMLLAGDRCFVSVNGGTSWTPIEDVGGTSARQGAISENEAVFALVGCGSAEGLVYHSYDLGTTWTLRPFADTSVVVASTGLGATGSIQVMACNTIVGGRSFLYRTDDTGATWYKIDAWANAGGIVPTPGGNSPIEAGITLSANGQVITAIMANSIDFYVSLDGGLQFLDTDLGDFGYDPVPVVLQLSGSRTGRFLVLLYGGYVLTSSDAGYNWSQFFLDGVAVGSGGSVTVCPSGERILTARFDPTSTTLFRSVFT